MGRWLGFTVNPQGLKYFDNEILALESAGPQGLWDFTW